MNNIYAYVYRAVSTSYVQRLRHISPLPPFPGLVRELHTMLLIMDLVMRKCCVMPDDAYPAAAALAMYDLL